MADIVERLADEFVPEREGYLVLSVVDSDLLRDARDEIERLRAERDDHKARLAIESFTAPDADFDTMMDSLQARLCDLHAEVERLRAAGDALADNLRRRAALSDMPPLLRGDGSWANVGQALDAWEEARRG